MRICHVGNTDATATVICLRENKYLQCLMQKISSNVHYFQLKLVGHLGSSDAVGILK